MAAHAHELCAAEIILDPRDGAFDVGALVVAPALGITDVRVTAPLALGRVSILGLFAAWVVADQPYPAGAAAVRDDRGGILRRVHECVEVGDPLTGQARQGDPWDRDVAVVEGY